MPVSAGLSGARSVQFSSVQFQLSFFIQHYVGENEASELCFIPYDGWEVVMHGMRSFVFREPVQKSGDSFHKSIWWCFTPAIRPLGDFQGRFSCLAVQPGEVSPSSVPAQFLVV